METTGTDPQVEDLNELLARATEAIFESGQAALPFRGGVEFELDEPVGAGRANAKDRETVVYRAHRLNDAREPVGQYAVKFCFGDSDAVWRDYEGWARYVAPDPPAFLRPYHEMDPEGHRRSVMIMQFVGGSFKELSKLSRERPELLPDTIEHLLRKLKPLHDYQKSRHGSRGCVALPQREFLFEDEPRTGRGARISREDRSGAVDRLSADLGEEWMAPEIVDVERGFRVHNWVRELAQGGGFPDEMSTCLGPIGVIHGDPNFENIFVSEELKALSPSQSIALIDYERTGRGCLFDDLARIECELLFSTLPLLDGRRRGIHSDSGLIPVAATWSWELGEGIPAGLRKDERAMFDAIRLVRQRAVRLASETAADTTNNAALERAYFSALFGRAFSYLRYDSLPAGQRPRALEACLLLADRLANESCQPPLVRFPDLLTGASGNWTCGPAGYSIEARRRAAHLTLREAIFDLQLPELELEFTMRDVSDGERAWIGLGVGARDDAWTSGPSIRIRANGRVVYVPELSGEPVRDLGEIAPLPTAAVLTAKVAVKPSRLTFACGRLVTSIERLVPIGRVHVGAFGCEAQIRRLAAYDRS